MTMFTDEGTTPTALSAAVEVQADDVHNQQPAQQQQELPNMPLPPPPQEQIEPDVDSSLPNALFPPFNYAPPSPLTASTSSTTAMQQQQQQQSASTSSCSPPPPPPPVPSTSSSSSSPLPPRTKPAAASVHSPGSTPGNVINSTMSADILDIQTLLWGPTIKTDIFARWSQGFVFSDSEPSALVQHQGGPCAVIVPVQAFVLRLLLDEGANVSTLAALTAAQCRTLLVQALCAILSKCAAVGTLAVTPRFRIVTVARESESNSGVTAVAADMQSPTTGVAQLPEAGTIACTETVAAGSSERSGVEESPPDKGHGTDREEMETMPNDDSDGIDVVDAVGRHVTDAASTAALVDEYTWTPPPDSRRFHASLCTREMQTIAEVQAHFTERIDELQQRYGVLLFMYSVLLTKRLAVIEEELLDTSEPLIHEVYGYASQALINLMLTGRAVANVWDNEQNIGGLSKLLCVCVISVCMFMNSSFSVSPCRRNEGHRSTIGHWFHYTYGTDGLLYRWLVLQESEESHMGAGLRDAFVGVIQR